MSETDKYLDAVYDVIGAALSVNVQAAAAYLREHFVTRERYEESQDAIERYLGQLATLTAERDRLRAALEGIKQIVHRRQLPITHQVYDAAQAALNPEDV